MWRNIWDRIRRFVGARLWVWSPSRRHRPLAPEAPPPIRAVWVEDPPELLADREVYLIGAPGTPAFAVVRCPCGCGARLAVNLLPEIEPCWTWEVDEKDILTLHPSLWRTTGCKSHFLLRQGRIIWCSHQQATNAP